MPSPVNFELFGTSARFDSFRPRASRRSRAHRKIQAAVCCYHALFAAPIYFAPSLPARVTSPSCFSYFIALAHELATRMPPPLFARCEFLADYASPSSSPPPSRLHDGICRFCHYKMKRFGLQKPRHAALRQLDIAYDALGRQLSFLSAYG